MWIYAQDKKLYNLEYATSIEVIEHDGEFAIVAIFAEDDPQTQRLAQRFGQAPVKKQIVLATSDNRSHLDYKLLGLVQTQRIPDLSDHEEKSIAFSVD